jgi:hypothetical protein
MGPGQKREVDLMLLLGLILIIAAAGVSIDVVLKNTSALDVSAFGQTFSTTPGWLFVAGLAAGAVGVLGVLLMTGGIGRARQRRATLKDLKQTHGTTEQLQAERDRLAAELEAERTRREPAVDLTDGGADGANRVEKPRVSRR